MRVYRAGGGGKSTDGTPVITSPPPIYTPPPPSVLWHTHIYLCVNRLPWGTLCMQASYREVHRQFHPSSFKKSNYRFRIRFCDFIFNLSCIKSLNSVLIFLFLENFIWIFRRGGCEPWATQRNMSLSPNKTRQGQFVNNARLIKQDRVSLSIMPALLPDKLDKPRMRLTAITFRWPEKVGVLSLIWGGGGGVHTKVYICDLRREYMYIISGGWNVDYIKFSSSNLKIKFSFLVYI